MNVSDSEIVAFLAKLIDGEVVLSEAEEFLSRSLYSLSEDALEAVTHYIDDVNIRRNDVGYEIWSRQELLNAYCSYVFGETFSIRQYANCLACRLGGRYHESARCESRVLCISKRTGEFIWELEIEFFVGRVRVVVRDSPLQERSDCGIPAIAETQLYDGHWTALDYRQLRKVALSGDADQMRRFAESCRQGAECSLESLSVFACPGCADTIDDTSAKLKNGGEVGVFLSKLINGEMTHGEAAAMLEQMRDSLPESVKNAVSNYVGNADVCGKDLAQDLWSRISLLAEYVTYVSGEKFSLKQYVQCLACKLGCRWGRLATSDLIVFCLKRRSIFSSWELTMNFSTRCITVSLREDSWLFRSRRRQRQIYDGPWLELDFHELRRRVMSGEVDRTMDPMKYRRPYEGGW